MPKPAEVTMQSAGVPQWEITPEEREAAKWIITDDGAPVDSYLSEIQMRLLATPLKSTWAKQRGNANFIVAANVGLFGAVKAPPIVPDVFLSLNPACLPLSETIDDRVRAYFFWEHKKPPEVAIEIVSNTDGNEFEGKPEKYAALGVKYYVVFDPDLYLKRGLLNRFVLQNGVYVQSPSIYMPDVGLGLSLWRGVFENVDLVWLRWSDADGKVIATPEETSEQERLLKEAALRREAESRQREEEARQREEEARQREEVARRREEQAHQRDVASQAREAQAQLKIERFKARFRTLGLDPDAMNGDSH